MKGEISTDSMIYVVLAVLVTTLIVTAIVTVSNNALPALIGCNELLTGLSNALGITLC
jgi:hypothetical protein